MPPKSDQLDALIEWHPGPSDAARASPVGAFQWAAGRVWQSKALVLWLWVAHIIVVRPAALWSWAPLPEALRTGGVRSAVGGPLWAWAVDWPSLFLNGFEATLWSTHGYFFVLYGLFAGGAISYLHARRPAPFWAQFAAGCGVYLGRFARLLMIGLGAFLVLLQVEVAVIGAVGNVGMIRPLMALLALLSAVTLDYARVRVVTTDSRSMVVEAWRSLLFVVRNLPRVLALQLMIGVVGLALTLGFGQLGPLLGAGAGRIALEAYVLCRIALKLLTWGALMALYKGIARERLSA